MMKPARTTTTIPQGPLRRNSLHGSGKVLQRKNPTRIATKRWIRMKMPILPRSPSMLSFSPSDQEGSTTGNRCFFVRGNEVYVGQLWVQLRLEQHPAQADLRAQGRARY